MRRILWAVGLAVSGCGPVEYVTIVTRQASRAVDDARRADADKLAPYEFTVAVESLHKSRELAGHSRWQDAVRFGQDALDQARKAAMLAEEKHARPEEKNE